MKAAVLVIMMEDGPESGQRQYPEQKISAGVLVVMPSLPVLISAGAGN